jgi:hypothetical protein
MRAVAERLMTYVARMTTVPGGASAAQPAPAPAPVHSTSPPALVSTTFGDSAAEVSTVGAKGRKAPKLIAAVVVLAGGAAAAAAFLGRGPAPAPEAPKPIAARAAEPPAAAAPPPAAAPSPEAPPAPAAMAPVAQSKPSSDKASPEKPSSNNSSKKNGHHAEAEPATRAPAKTAAATEPATPKGPPELPGTWEGPWTDHAHNQHGRFLLQLQPGGSVAGWMTNTAAKQSYRMVGAFSPSGALDLTCQCPAGQQFGARGTVRAETSGELVGDLALASQSGVFGQARLALRRSASQR